MGSPSFPIFIRLILIILSALSNPPTEDYPVIVRHPVITHLVIRSIITKICVMRKWKLENLLENFPVP